jgi:putative ATP-binding cassette transporter
VADGLPGDIDAFPQRHERREQLRGAIFHVVYRKPKHQRVYILCLGLRWRVRSLDAFCRRVPNYLTRHVVRAYIDKGLYLQLQHEGAITNPDQRMTEDIRNLTTTTLSFILMISNGTLTALSFSGVLWTISPKLFVIAVLYAAAGSALTILLGRPLVRLNYQQSDFEANFRSELIALGTNADRIALAGVEGRVRDQVLARIDGVVENLKRIIRVNLNLNFFTGGYNYMIQLIPTLVVAPLFISRGVEFGVIAQAAMAFSTLLGAFSLVITQFQAISSYASVVARLKELVEASETAARRSRGAHLKCATAPGRVTFSGLTLFGADDPGKILVQNLNASFVSGKRVLVGGSNQDARTALFLVVAGLHEEATGSIARPSPEKLMFLPEHPYLLAGTLRDLVVPFGNSVVADELAALLKELRLEEMVREHGGLDAVRKWHKVLSLEQQQRVTIARAMLVRPDFVFLLELDSAFGDEEHARILKLLAQRGITCVSFGNYPPDRARFDAVLDLHEHGMWEWRELRESAAK